MVMEEFLIKCLHCGSNCNSPVPEVFCFVFWSLTFFIGVVYNVLTKRATLSPKNPVCKIFNMAFLQDEIKEDKNKSTAEAKSISSFLCIETASYAAHQTASSLICCPLTQKETQDEKKGVQTFVLFSPLYFQRLKPKAGAQKCTRKLAVNAGGRQC